MKRTWLVFIILEINRNPVQYKTVKFREPASKDKFPNLKLKQSIH